MDTARLLIDAAGTHRKFFVFWDEATCRNFLCFFGFVFWYNSREGNICLLVTAHIFNATLRYIFPESKLMEKVITEKEGGVSLKYCNVIHTGVVKNGG